MFIVLNPEVTSKHSEKRKKQQAPKNQKNTKCEI